MEKMKYEISSEWEITDRGESTKIFRIKVTRQERSLMISQKQCVNSILKRQGMLYANPIAMLLDSNIKLEPMSDNEEGDRSNCYASLLREFQFLANATSPDIVHAVSQLTSYTANPGLQHVGALKRVLNYLKGMKSYRLTFTSSCIANNNANMFWGYVLVAHYRRVQVNHWICVHSSRQQYHVDVQETKCDHNVIHRS